jgi:hypothetical protein
MARRFGGKYSPDAAPQADEGAAPALPRARRSRAAGRARLLFFPAFAFLIPAFQGDPREMVISLVAAALVLLSAWLTQEGVKAQEAYDDRRVARRPAIPRKIFGAVVMAAALFTGGMLSQPGLLYPLLFAVLGAALHLFAFGPDPLRDKGLEGVDQFQTDRVARAVDEGEKYLAGMKDAILRADDRMLEGRVERFAAAARQLFRTIEGDPGDLTAARKYMSVYLMGARDATVKFADHYARTRDAAVRSEYEALLTDLETNFAQRTRALLADSHTDLDVEIQVLRERLKLEA